MRNKQVTYPIIWNKKQVDTLIRMYPDTPAIEIANHLGATANSIYAKAKRLGLKKSDAYLERYKSGRLIKGTKFGESTRFNAGQSKQTAREASNSCEAETNIQCLLSKLISCDDLAQNMLNAQSITVNTKHGTKTVTHIKGATITQHMIGG